MWTLRGFADVPLLVLITMVFGSVNASHFRGGIIMVRPRPEGSESEVSISRVILIYM